MALSICAAVSANWPEYGMMSPILIVSSAWAVATPNSVSVKPARHDKNFCIFLSHYELRDRSLGGRLMSRSIADITSHPVCHMGRLPRAGHVAIRRPLRVGLCSLPDKIRVRLPAAGFDRRRRAEVEHVALNLTHTGLCLADPVWEE